MRTPVNYVSFIRGFKNTGSNKHYGIDYGFYSQEHKQQNVYAVDDGVVIYNRKQISGGYVIHIRHNNGFVSEYGHLLKNSQKVHEGDTVKKGQVIAKLGASGMVTGPHLHFGLYKGTRINYSDKSKYVDPAKYLNVYSDQVENDKTKGKFLHTKKVKGTDGELNVRQSTLRGKVVYKVDEGDDIESFGTSGSYNIVDNTRNYVCSKNYVK